MKDGDPTIESPELPDTRPSDPAGEASEIEGLGTIDPEHYLISQEFARGGLGRILRAFDRRLGRQVALKELISRTPNLEGRFNREVMLTARLQHPSIVPVYEAGRWPSGDPFYAMKLVDGRSLADIIEDRDSLEGRLALLPAVIDVAEAIAYAHSERIIHRDLKPANVLLGPFGETVVIDWGLAKDLRAADKVNVGTAPPNGDSPAPRGYDTADGIIVGTVHYMPPEQAYAKDVDERSDVYALGAILYEVLTGLRPYEDVPSEEVLRMVRSSPPKPVDELAPRVPSELVTIVEKAMARRPGDRYPTAQEMAEELKRFTTGQLVGAHHYTLFETLWRFVDKNSAAFTVGFTAFLLLLAFSAWSFGNVAEQKRVAEERVREMVLEKASSLLETDPTSALAWLKQLDEIPAGAATIAADALDRGVARFVFRGHQGPVDALSIASNSRTVASVGADRTLRIWDLDDGTEREFVGHTDRTTNVALSRDGRWAATSSNDLTVRLWNLETGEVRVLRGHTGKVQRVLFSPNDRRLVSLGSDDTIRIWPVGEDSEALVLKATSDRNLDATFTPNGESLVTSSHQGSIVVWDLESGHARTLIGHEGTVESIAISPDGMQLASGGSDGTVRLWFLASGDSDVVSRHQAMVRSVRFSPDGKYLASAGLDQVVKLLDLSTWRTKDLTGHEERITRIEFSADGRFLATASWDKTARVFDLEAGDSKILRGHGDVVSDLGWAQEGRLLVTASWDETLRVFEMEPPRQRVLRGHEIGVQAVAFSPDGLEVASGGYDNMVRIFDLQTKKSEVLIGHTDHVLDLRYSRDGRHLASSSDDETVRLWDTDSLESRVLQGHTEGVQNIEFSPDARHLASGGEDDAIWLWDVETTKGTAFEGHQGDVTDLDFSPDAQVLVSASRDATIRLWRVGPVDSAWFRREGRETGSRRVRIFRGHDDEVNGVAFSPVTAQIASVSSDRTLRIFDIATGRNRILLTADAPLILVRYSADGRYLFAASAGKSAYLCAAKAGRCDLLSGHSTMIRDAEFDRFNTALVTVSGDHTLRVWDLETQENRVFYGHRAPIFAVDLSLDGALIATASGDTEVRLWPLQLPPRPERLSAWLSNVTAEIAQ
jgi:WD40 repeat protein/serine/threonine protein kinase